MRIYRHESRFGNRQQSARRTTPSETDIQTNVKRDTRLKAAVRSVAFLRHRVTIEATVRTVDQLRYQWGLKGDDERQWTTTRLIVRDARPDPGA